MKVNGYFLGLGIIFSMGLLIDTIKSDFDIPFIVSGIYISLITLFFGLAFPKEKKQKSPSQNQEIK